MKTIEQHRNNYSRKPYPNWKRLGFKGFELAIDRLNSHELHSVEVSPLSTGTVHVERLETLKRLGVKIHVINSEQSDLDDVLYKPYEQVLERVDRLSYSNDSKYTDLVEGFFNTGVLIEIPDGLSLSENIVITYKAEEHLLDYTFVQIGKGAKANVLIQYETAKDLVDHCGLTKVYIKSQGRFKLNKLQNFNENCRHVDNVVVLEEDQAVMEYVSAEVGGNLLATNYQAFLEGVASESHAYSAYLGTHEQRLDMAYKTTHIGRKTKSTMDVRGALKDQAKKVFRGDLKFEKGAKGASGTESEFVILLDKEVQSQAIPALLCDEDDVVGEHAASAGQVDQDKLFYLMSRGFSEKEAKQLIILGSFAEVLDRIVSEKAKEALETTIEGRLLNGESS